MAEHGGIDRGTLHPPSMAPASGERVEILASGPTWRIEEVLSGRLDAPIEDVLDHVEWVTILSGHAILEVDGEIAPMLRGDWIRLGPGVCHRVISTDPGTRWLAVHVEVPAGLRVT